jgi:hypothetical protein
MNLTVNQVMYNAEAQKEFAALYKSTFGKTVNCNTCPGSLYKEYFKLKNHLSLGKEEQVMTKNFILKSGALITFKGSVYSEAFLPEAVAIDMLTSNRTFYEKKFKSINEDLLKEVPVEKVAKVKAEVITEEVVNEVFAEVAIEKVTKHIKKRKAK